MSSVILVVSGVLLLLAVLIDLAWTALAVSHGSGPLTAAILRLGWRIASPFRSRGAHRSLAVAGVITVLATLAAWVVLLWAAWSLIFLAPSGGLVDAAGASAGRWDRVYFAGYSLFTLGNGEFRPEGAIWQFATVVAALSGLTVISLAIAYLVLVTSAASERHSVAAQISLLGATPNEVVLSWWASPDRSQFDSVLQSLAMRIVELTQRHLAYPVLHFFHSAERRSSPPAAIAMLDDAITVLAVGVTASVRPSGFGMRSVRRAIDDYVDLVGRRHEDDAPEPPPLLLRELAEQGVPVTDADDFDRALQAFGPRRSALHQLVVAEGFARDAGRSG